jgi:hypothetical protein
VPLARPERRRRGLISALLSSRRPAAEAGLPDPVARQLAQPEKAVVAAADLFNTSPYRRTVEGLSRSLGEPRISIVPLSGLNPEVVITFAWEISWYQYRVDFDSAQPVRLAERGADLEELQAPFTGWNAHLSPEGLLVPEAEPV